MSDSEVKKKGKNRTEWSGKALLTYEPGLKKVRPSCRRKIFQ
jgi:hypothetical protein